MCEELCVPGNNPPHHLRQQAGQGEAITLDFIHSMANKVCTGMRKVWHCTGWTPNKLVFQVKFKAYCVALSCPNIKHNCFFFFFLSSIGNSLSSRHPDLETCHASYLASPMCMTWQNVIKFKTWNHKAWQKLQARSRVATKLRGAAPHSALFPVASQLRQPTCRLPESRLPCRLGY